jgi:hypothetical protein
VPPTSTEPLPLAGPRLRPRTTPGWGVTVAASPTVGPDGRPLHAPRACVEGEHRLRVVGYLRGPGSGRVDCDRPLRVVCRDCDHVDVWACAGHRESRCKPCARRYRRRVRSVAESGLRRHRGFLYLLTLTAPGEHAHRGPGGVWCPCTPVGGVDLPAWNATHSARWNRALTALRRRYAGLEFWRGVEVQDRGALHDHALIWSPTPMSKPDLRRLAVAAGFGHQVDLQELDPHSRKAAYYVSKYVSKATDARADVPWQLVDASTGELVVGPGRYRTWSMSRGWGDTMAGVRAQARAHARSAAVVRDRQALDGALGVLLASGLLAPDPPPVAGDGAGPPA